MINADMPVPDDMKGMPLGAAKLLNGPCANVVMEMRKPFNTIGYKGKTMAMIARGMDGYSISVFDKKGGISGSAIPLLNGEPVTEHSVKLQEHDILEISGFQMEFIYLH